MMRFELPMAHEAISIADALAETIDCNTCGVLFQTTQGDLRLVHFDRMVDALETGLTLLQDVPFEPVVNIEASPNSKHESVVRAAGGKFGFLRATGGTAHLFSVSEQFASSYISASSGVRCERPNKPQGTPDRAWYHYYPPYKRDSANPNRCRFDGSNVP